MLGGGQNVSTGRAKDVPQRTSASDCGARGSPRTKFDKRYKFVDTNAFLESNGKAQTVGSLQMQT